jgi:hypothetical protein
VGLNRWKALLAIGLALGLAVGSVWVIHLIRHSDKVLTRWASTTNIIGLPVAFASLLVGTVALLMQRSTDRAKTTEADRTDNPTPRPRETPETPVERKADHGSTYIEITRGSVSIAQPEGDGNDKQGDSSPRLEKLVFRAIKTTPQGESQEVQFFDVEIAEKWIKRDPWGGASRTGTADGE